MARRSTAVVTSDGAANTAIQDVCPGRSVDPVQATRTAALYAR